MKKKKILFIIIFTTIFTIFQYSATGIETNTSVIQVMTVLVEGHAIADLIQPGATIRAFIADIKQAALDQNDKNLGGLVHSIRPVGLATQPQEDGLHVVSVRLTYEIRYVETYGI